MSKFQPFLMERMMSKYEQAVDYNLTESGVHPVLLGELLGDDPGEIKRLLEVELNYPHANGNPALRENIAALYPGATAENVLVTVGAAEANYDCIHTLLSAGDEIVIMLPNYMQVWGIAQNLGLKVQTFDLHKDRGWSLDPEQLAAVVSAKTKMIAVCNPNNPTGHILTEAEMDAIVAAADRVGAWILADEVYRGVERTQELETPTFYGRHDKVCAVGSLSKAYGLPGLRLGWVVCPPEMMDQIWSRHEYISISASMLANRLATLALSPEVRPRLRKRAKDYIHKGYTVLQSWMDGHQGLFNVVPPQAAAIAFVGYNLDINSTRFTEQLREEKSVLLVPGDHCGIDRHLRISFGLPHDYLVPALDRINELLTALKG